MVSNRPQYTIIEKGKEHKKEIISLWQNNLSSARAFEKRYHWFYETNPYGKAQTWLLKTCADEIIGCSSVFPRKLFVQGDSITTLTASDLAVNQNHRSLGPAILLQRAIVEKCLTDPGQFIFAHPNQAAKGVTKRVRYKAIGKEHTWTKALRSRQKIKKIIKNPAIAYFLGSILDMLIGIHLSLFYRLYAYSYDIKILDTCDDRFDNLWNRAKKNHKITTEKNKEYLNWRFSHHTSRAIKFFCIFNKQKELKGFIAYSADKKVVTIEEVVPEDFDRHFFNVMIAFAYHIRKEGYHSIMMKYLGGTELHKSMNRLLFIYKGKTGTCFAFFPKDFPSKTKELILNEQNWSLVGDFDI